MNMTHIPPNISSLAHHRRLSSLISAAASIAHKNEGTIYICHVGCGPDVLFFAICWSFSFGLLCSVREGQVMKKK